MNTYAVRDPKMIANERPQRYDAYTSNAARDTVDFANDMELDHDYNVLPTIVAENAALKVKLKQECDIAYVTEKNISKADDRIGSLKRDIIHYDQLIDIKSKEVANMEEELTNLSISREHVRSNAENLKRQHELITIEDEQRKKEQDSVRSNYEKMIENRKEIFNSNRLVVRRNHLRNQCEGARIQSAVLEERLKELHRQKIQFREIQNLNLKSVSVELAQVWLNNKNEKDRSISLRNQLREKKASYDRVLSQKSKNETNNRSPGSRFVSLPMPTLSQPLQIPSLNAEETELTKYFRKINVFKKGRTVGLLPNVLSRSIAVKEKESDSPTNIKISYQSPVKNNVAKTPIQNVNSNEKQTSESPKLSLEEARKTSAFQPVNAAKKETPAVVEIKLQDDDSTAITEKPRQTPTFMLDNNSPISPGKVNSSKFKPVEKYVSPLTVSRMSPLNTSANKSPMRTSRIPVPLSTSSPIHANSRIPVRRTPVNVNQKRDYVEKETISRRLDAVKKVYVRGSSPIDIQIDTSKNQAFKRTDVGSPRRGVKYPKMDYAYLNANRNLTKGALDSGEIPTIEVDEDVSNEQNYRRDEPNLENLIDEVNNENNPMIKSYHERMKILREEYAGKDAANDNEDIEILKKSVKDSKTPEIAREPFKIDNRHSNRNTPALKGVYETDGTPTIEVDQIEEDVDENNPTIKSSLERLQMLSERYVRKNAWKDGYERDDNEILKKSTKEPKRQEFVREPYKLDTRRFVRDQIDVKHANELAKLNDKFQANLYRPQPRDFRDIEKIDPKMTSKDSSRFEKMEESVKNVPEELARTPNKYKDVAYPKSSEIFLESSEKLSKSSASSIDNRNRSEVYSPFGNFISPPGSNAFSPPFGALGERGGSMFGYDTGVNQLFGPSADGASQSQNQNNGFFGFGFTTSDQNDQPLKIF